MGWVTRVEFQSLSKPLGTLLDLELGMAVVERTSQNQPRSLRGLQSEKLRLRDQPWSDSEDSLGL